MDLVVDANILFAALIKRGATSNLLFFNGFHLYAPEFLLEEFGKYRSVIMDKTECSKREFEELLEAYLRRINLVPKEEILPLIPEAIEISPDHNDSVYFAVALKVDAGLWSNDSVLKKQRRIEVYSTSDLLEIVHLQSLDK